MLPVAMLDGDFIRLFTLWERRSRDGRPYFSGYLGECKVLVFRDDRAAPPEGAVALWNVLLQEKPRKPAARADTVSIVAERREGDGRSRSARAPSRDSRRASNRRLRHSGQAAARFAHDPLDDVFPLPDAAQSGAASSA
jgi:hypothetical protein